MISHNNEQFRKIYTNSFPSNWIFFLHLVYAFPFEIQKLHI